MTAPSPRFLSQLAHDLRSPLNVIGSTLTELAQEAGVSTADRAMIVTLSQRAVGRLISLSDRLGLASQLAEPFSVDLVPLDLKALTQATVDAFRPAHLRKRIDVVTAFPEGPVMLEGDAVLLTTLLLELVANANRFARRMFRIEITVGTTTRLTVEDDGEGVREDERACLFEPFAERRSRSGLGMGLWLARRLAELHGGTILVEHLTPGTRAVISLPASK